jgi:hypothetical protein
MPKYVIDIVQKELESLGSLCFSHNHAIAPPCALIDICTVNKFIKYNSFNMKGKFITSSLIIAVLSVKK